MKGTPRPILKQFSVIKIIMLLMLMSVAVPLLMLRVSAPPNESVWGTVYAISGVPVENAVVTATSDTGFGRAITDVNGQYSITTGLPAGNYTLTVLATGYLQATVENVTVTVGETTIENAYLYYSGGISGKITDAKGSNALLCVEVVAMSSNGKYRGVAFTNVIGIYTIATNLATGTYNVTAIAFTVAKTGYISKTLGSISVTEGTITTGQDMALEHSGTISGTVTDNSSDPLSNANVTAVSTSMAIGAAKTDSFGQYSITDGLANGSYTVTATYSGGSAIQTNVTVVEDQPTSNINFTITPTSSTIRGKITDSTSLPIANCLVGAKGQNTSSSQSAYSDASGNYMISTGLPDDTYNVTASAPGYIQSSQIVNATIGNFSQADFTMTKIPPQQSGTISGTITGDPNPPIPEYESPLVVLLLLTLATVAIAKSSNHKIRPNRTERNPLKKNPYHTVANSPRYIKP